MPDGVTHFVAGLCVGGAAVLAADLYAGAAVAAPLAAGCGIGLLITPDLDQEGTTFTERSLRGIPVLGWLFQVSFYPYALLFRHRGWSHNLLVGTATRVLYVAALALVWLALASGVASWTGRATVGWPQAMAAQVQVLFNPAVAVGWWLQDATHVALDWLF